MSISAFAPGRVEILGNHTDYNGGVVLSAALCEGITCEGEVSLDGSIRLTSGSAEGEYYLPSGEEMLPSATWADYPLGVVGQMRGAGFPVGGFTARFSSNLPTGAGLSSSAAMEVSTAMFLCRLFGFRMGAAEMAGLCRRAENEFVGVNCGLLDQASSVFGKAGHLVHLDCLSECIETIPMPDGFALLIVNSGIRHALTGGEYNERREQCFAAAEAVGVERLRDATSEMLLACEMPEIVRRRGLHITGEDERVESGVAALREGGIEAFGRLLFESHESSRTNFENSVPELDLLVELARSTPGVLGSRLSGGGFGGATVSLVRGDDAASAARSIAERYLLATGRAAMAMVCHPGDGAFAHAGWAPDGK